MENVSMENTCEGKNKNFMWSVGRRRVIETNEAEVVFTLYDPSYTQNLYNESSPTQLNSSPLYLNTTICLNIS